MATQRVGHVRWSAERRFFTFMTLAIFAAVYVGFARTFFLRPWFPEMAPLVPPEPFFILHGVVFTAWFVVLLVQPALVGMGRTDLHRAFGRIGAGVAASVVVVGAIGAFVAARRPGGFMGVPVPPQQFVLIPLVDMIVFSALVGIAFARRRDAQAHKRLMIVASIALIDAAIARWPGVIEHGPVAFFALADAFLLPLVIWDLKTRGRLHPATLWGGLLLIVSQPLRLWLMGTDAWQAFAHKVL
jgi:uncharacterized membrane protein YozB (DUF420 family)